MRQYHETEKNEIQKLAKMYRNFWMQEKQNGNAAAISAESQKKMVLKIWRMCSVKENS